MMDIDKKTIQEWNNLKFYYEYEKDLKQWRLWGSKSGLYNFVELIKLHINNPSNYEISEHSHLGPYNYLKIMTWDEPTVTDNYIGGSLSDLLKLASIITKKLEQARIGEMFVVFHDYSFKSTSKLLFIVMSDNFLPSSMDQ